MPDNFGLLGSFRPYARVVINSKEVREGDLFVALKGSRHDGHDFVEEAFHRGAVGVIVERAVRVPEGRFALVVRDSLEFLRILARKKREAFRGKVIAIAGSVGKTTTKEMIAFLLSKVAKTCKTPKNYNSQVGVPLSVANFEQDCEFWVVEVGASQRGDVAKLVEIIEPHVRAITAIGEEHLETFGCLDDVVMGNGEVFRDMKEEDVSVCPHEVSHCYLLPKKITFGEGSNFFAREISLGRDGVRFRVLNVEVFVPIPSLGVVENTLCSFAVLQALGFNWKDFVAYLKDFKAVEGRFRTYQLGSWFVIDDAYNANPPSMRKALQTLSMFKGFKVAVLGDMLELGTDSDRFHREVGELCAKLGIDLCLFYGPNMKHAWEECQKGGGKAIHFEDKGPLREFLMKLLDKHAVVLFKGSRGMRLEEVLNGLQNENIRI